MRTGKSACVILAAQFLFEAGKINRVIVITPAPVRDVWADERLGELAKHLWADVPATVTEYHAKIRTWRHNLEFTDGRRRLEWFVTNFEFIRAKTRLIQLLRACGPKTMLVLDESSFVKNWAAQQTVACVQLRRACGRVVLLNGTPIFLSPLDLFSQGNLLHRSVLDCPYITQFKSRYAVQEAVRGFGGKPLLSPRGRAVMKISGWVNLDDLQKRFAPITVRRLQKDCLDLPPKLDPVTLTATLTPETWRVYKDMRDELVVWLNENTVATSATAAVKAMRLSQITSGFLGGIEGAGVEECDERRTDEEGLPVPGGLFDSDPRGAESNPAGAGETRVREVGREKLDVLLWFIEKRLEEDPNLHLVSWCRFRAELMRTLNDVRVRFPQFECGAIMGAQKRDERLHALALLKPETTPSGPVFVCGVEGTGSFGLDMTASHTCVTMSSGYSPGRSAQTLDRVYGPAQTHPIAYFSILATGPQGQRTIDHAIEEARRAGQDVASWTSAAWIKALTAD